MLKMKSVLVLVYRAIEFVANFDFPFCQSSFCFAYVAYQVKLVLYSIVHGAGMLNIDHSCCVLQFLCVGIH